MPSFDIVKKLDIKETYRVACVLSDFDMDKSKGDVHFKGEIEIPENWNVGLIYGASGTGKTTLVKELFPDAVVDEFSWGGGVVFRRFPKGHPVRGNFKDALCCGYGLGAFLGTAFSRSFKWRENARHLGAWLARKRLLYFRRVYVRCGSSSRQSLFPSGFSILQKTQKEISGCFVP